MKDIINDFQNNMSVDLFSDSEPETSYGVPDSETIYDWSGGIENETE